MLRQYRNGEGPTTGRDLPLDSNKALTTVDEARILPAYLGPDYCRVYSAAKWHEHHMFQARITPTELDWYLRGL